MIIALVRTYVRTYLYTADYLLTGFQSYWNYEKRISTKVGKRSEKTTCSTISNEGYSGELNNSPTSHTASER